MEYTLIQKIEILRDIYNNIKQKVKKIKKTDKKTYKKVSRNLEYKLEKRNESFIEINEKNNDYYSLSYDFLYNLLEKNRFIVKDSKIINIECLKKDKNFMLFFENSVVFIDYLDKNSFLYSKVELFMYHTYFRDISSLVLSYFIINENNITYTKIMNVLSFFLKGSNIITKPFYISENIDKKIKQITTGIKYEKEKKTVNNDDYEGKRDYEKSNKFNLLQFLSTRIIIKYTSEKKPQKKKTTHYREGTTRTYKSGLVVNVRGCIVNEKMVS